MAIPNTTHRTSHGTSSLNACFVGTILYPDYFEDAGTKTKTDDIYLFSMSDSMFAKTHSNAGSLVYLNWKIILFFVIERRVK
jgi:hypothetical protein